MMHQPSIHTDEKFLSEFVANQIQWFVKKDNAYNKAGFIPDGWYNIQKIECNVIIK